MTDPCAVKVAVRVRPLISHEVERGCKQIVEVIPQNDQVVLKTLDKGFTFNYALGADTPQDELYNRCVAPLLKNLFEGIIKLQLDKLNNFFKFFIHFMKCGFKSSNFLMTHPIQLSDELIGYNNFFRTKCYNFCLWTNGVRQNPHHGYIL